MLVLSFGNMCCFLVLAHVFPLRLLAFPEWLTPCFRPPLRRLRAPGHLTVGSYHRTAYARVNEVLFRAELCHSECHSSIFGNRREHSWVYNPCSPRLCGYLVYQASTESKTTRESFEGNIDFIHDDDTK